MTSTQKPVLDHDHVMEYDECQDLACGYFIPECDHPTDRRDFSSNGEHCLDCNALVYTADEIREDIALARAEADAEDAWHDRFYGNDE